MEVRQNLLRVVANHNLTRTCFRPITSYGALDLPTYFLDITPFAPLVSDGQPHTISLDVASAETDHSINQNWFVSGLVQIVTDPSGKQTTGNITVYVVNDFATTQTTGNVSDTGDVVVTVSAQHDVHIEATVVSGSGNTTNVVVNQHLTYSNTQEYLQNATIQVLDDTHALCDEQLILSRRMCSSRAKVFLTLPTTAVQPSRTTTLSPSTSTSPSSTPTARNVSLIPYYLQITEAHLFL